MTNSEVMDSQPNIQADSYISQISQPSSPGILSVLRILEYLSLATAIGSGIATYLYTTNIKLIVTLAVSLSLFTFLFLLNRQLQKNHRNSVYNSNLLRRASLYGNVSQLQKCPENTQITQAVEKALSYCQELINEYKKVRKNDRNVYYILQLGTIVLSGITPILVLVDKLETNQPWLKWLPVIFPAVASIIASISTSLNFEENWISANRIVELLEAEQEKFILGANPAYRVYDIEDPTERSKKARNSIANFITKVNYIHLKQVEGQEAVQQQEEKKEEKTSRATSTSPQSLLENK